MAVTTRFSNSIQDTKHTILQISDATTSTVIKKEIGYYASLPTIPTAAATPDMVIWRDRGLIQGVETGDDQIDFPEFSIPIDMTAADVAGTSPAFFSTWFAMMNDFMSPADGTTPLVTTNVGSANVKNGFDPTTSATKSFGIPIDMDTLRLEILFEDATRKFGFKWEQVQPLGIDISGESTVIMTLKFKVWCAPVAMVALTT